MERVWKNGPPARALVLVFASLPGPGSAAGAPLIPLEPGLRLVSVLQHPGGDRENVVTVERADDRSVTYAWSAVARAGGQRTEAQFRREVTRADLAGATRLNTAFRSGDQADYPGYTAFTVSSAVYQALVGAGTAPLTLATFDEPPRGAAAMLGAMQASVKFKGTLTRVAAEDFPLIVDGRRVRVPSIHAQGRFTHDGRIEDREFWFLADAAHPLILRSRAGRDVLQVVRVERAPAKIAGALESALQTDCRADLSGVYFEFGSAALDATSRPALEQIAALFARHPDWVFSLEGHTDDIGAPAANLTLSEARARAVRERLAAVVPAASRVTVHGFGASRPRESNATLEGRARNRRVELVRACPSH